MSQPVSHSVVLVHERLIAAVMRARSRRSLSAWWYFGAIAVTLFLAIALAGPVAFWVAQQMPFEWMFVLAAYLPTLVLIVLGLIAVVAPSWVYDRANRRKLLREFARLGIPLENAATYDILPEGLRLATARITIQPTWAAVDTVEKVSDGWVISADQLTMFVPAESFADEAAEKRFISALASHLTDAARARSPQACELAS